VGGGGEAEAAEAEGASLEGLRHEGHEAAAQAAPPPPHLVALVRGDEAARPGEQVVSLRTEQEQEQEERNPATTVKRAV